jgi:hypothetical protein
MPKKKFKKPDTRTGEDIALGVPGDFCFYLSTSNKPTFAEIKAVRTENDILIFQIICQVDHKWMWVPAVICAFDPIDLKGKKRVNLYPEYK